MSLVQLVQLATDFRSFISTRKHWPIKKFTRVVGDRWKADGAFSALFKLATTLSRPLWKAVNLAGLQ